MKKRLMLVLLCLVILMAGAVLPAQISRVGLNFWTITVTLLTAGAAVAVFYWIKGLSRDKMR
jgi:hypothetical protein